MKEIKEQLISFETAKLAKEKRFDIKVQSYYLYNEKYNKGILNYVDNPLKNADWNLRSTRTSAPTQSLLQKWLREIHGIHINVDFGLQWGYQLIKHGTDLDFSEEFIDNKGFLTYEEALEIALQEALKLI